MPRRPRLRAPPPAARVAPSGARRLHAEWGKENLERDPRRLIASRAEACPDPDRQVIRRGNIMRDGVQTASIYPFSTQKIFAPPPFCKWLVKRIFTRSESPPPTA